MPYVFMPIESTARELDYKLNLARLFCAHGFKVIVGNPPFIRDELKYKNYKGIFLEKGLNPDPQYYANLANKGVYLYDLGDEGAAEPVYSVDYAPAVEALKVMRKIFLWGEAQKEDLIKRNSDPVLQQKYTVTGNPGYDLCLSKYKDFNTGLKPKSLPDSYILVNTNFGCVQSYDAKEHFIACNAMSPSSRNMIEAGYRKEALQWPVFQEWLEDIIKSFPNENFVIRPHPTEILENYEKIFGKYKNVMVSKEGNVNYVIHAAKLVLHKDCSTAMQSYLMDVLSISLGGEALYKEYVQWPLNFSLLPNYLSEAKRFIQQMLNNKINSGVKENLDNKARELLDRQFYNLGNSAEALVKTIMEDSVAVKTNFTPYKLVDSRSFIQKIKMLVRKRMPIHYKVPKISRETLVEFTKKAVLERLNLLESVDPTGSAYVVEKIFPNTFKIVNKKNS